MPFRLRRAKLPYQPAEPPRVVFPPGDIDLRPGAQNREHSPVHVPPQGARQRDRIQAQLRGVLTAPLDADVPVGLVRCV